MRWGGQSRVSSEGTGSAVLFCADLPSSQLYATKNVRFLKQCNENNNNEIRTKYIVCLVSMYLFYVSGWAQTLYFRRLVFCMCAEALLLHATDWLSMSRENEVPYA